MSEDELSKQQVEEIGAALDRVVDDLPWEQSVFLSALGKKFAQIRDEFKRDVGLDEHALEKKNSEKERFKLAEGQLEVFISLYNAQGNDLSHWSRIIGNLTNQSVSRPTYDAMKDVKEMIRSKNNINNEGFVSVYITREDLLKLPDERQPKDKLGHPLLVLKERAITHDKIRKFYHVSGIYEYKKGLLNRLGPMTYSDKD